MKLTEKINQLLERRRPDSELLRSYKVLPDLISKMKKQAVSKWGWSKKEADKKIKELEDKLANVKIEMNQRGLQ